MSRQCCPLPRQVGHGRAHVTRLKLLPILVSMFAVISTSAYAGLFDDNEARKAILDLRARFEAFQRETNERLSQLNSRIERLEQTSRGQLELSNQIEQLRSEMARLRGQLEVQTNELVELQRRNRDQLAQFNDRLRRFDPVSVTIDGKTFQVDPAERRAYDAAITAFQNGDFKASQAAFASFITQYPQSPYRANAEYWAATGLFAQRDWRGALTALQSFISRHPDSARQSEALLSIGIAQQELRELANARKSFEQVIEKFPDSSAAKEARERMSTFPPERTPRR